MRKQLTTTEKGKALELEPGFLGVFAINQIPQDVPQHCALSFVANLQPDNLPGNHWVAVRRSASGRGYYFDTFGRMPPREIQHWLMKNCSNWTYNKLIVQKLDDSSACGYMCIRFVKYNKL